MAKTKESITKVDEAKVTDAKIEELKVKVAGQRSEADLQLMQQLIQAPELLLPETTSDKKYNKLEWKIELENGAAFILSDYILSKVAPYEKKFPKIFFYLVADMFGIDREEMDKFRKSRVVAIFIIQFIYARFPRPVFNQLKRRCKFTQVFGIREYKLFQWLTEERSRQLDIFIEQAITVMEQSIGINDFKKKYFKAYPISFQTELFN